MLLGVSVAGLGGPGAVRAQLTQGEALRLAFPPPARIERRTAFLSEAQLARARELAGPEVEVSSRVVSYYVGLEGDRALGFAYFDAHRVRTLNQVLMIVVGPDARVQRIEVLEFREPPEYRASPAWLGQLLGKRLDPELSLKGAVANLTGATLTSRAALRAVRRVLALHAVIAPALAPAAKP